MTGITLGFRHPPRLMPQNQGTGVPGSVPMDPRRGIVGGGRMPLMPAHEYPTTQPVYQQPDQSDMAALGRNGDTAMAHVTPGEMVIPREVQAMRPDLVAHVQSVLQNYGVDPSRYTVGRGRINPNTGAEEFATAEEITAAYQSQLGRAPDAAGMDYWLKNPDSFSNGGFAAGAQNELAMNKTAAPTSGYKFVNYGGQQVLGLTDAEKANMVDGAASYGKMTGKQISPADYDKMINPQTYGARWNSDGTPKTPGADATAIGSSGVPMAGTGSGIVSGGSNVDTMHTSSSSSHGDHGAKDGYAAWNVTPEQTVEGRIQAIINPNNPISQQARAGALEQMNNRGMVNSSIATTAADDAAYRAAVPIAQADAATFAKASGYDADIQNQMSMQQRQLGSQERIANLNATTQKTIAGWDNATKLQAQTLQQENQTLLQTNSQAAQAFNTATSAVSAIQNNNQMDANTKTQAIAQIWADVQRQLGVLGKVAKVDLSSNLNFANMPGFDASGRWVGFPASPATTANTTSISGQNESTGGSAGSTGSTGSSSGSGISGGMSA